MDVFTAETQRLLSILWLIGFFGVLIGQGLGVLKDVPLESLFALTGVMLFFWFQRQRSQSTTLDPSTTTTTQTTQTQTTPTAGDSQP